MSGLRLGSDRKLDSYDPILVFLRFLFPLGCRLRRADALVVEGGGLVDKGVQLVDEAGGLGGGSRYALHEGDRGHIIVKVVHT